MQHVTAMLLLVPMLAVTTFGADDNADAMTDRTKKALALPADFEPAFVLVCNDEDRKYTPEEAKQHGADILRGEVAHVGGKTLLFKTVFAHPFDTAVQTFNIYLDMDNSPETGRQDPSHKGVDIMLMLSEKGLNPSPRSDFYKENRPSARYALQGNTLYIAMTAEFTPVDGKLRLSVHYLSGTKVPEGRQDGTRRVAIDVPIKE